METGGPRQTTDMCKLQIQYVSYIMTVVMETGGPRQTTDMRKLKIQYAMPEYVMCTKLEVNSFTIPMNSVIFHEYCFHLFLYIDSGHYCFLFYTIATSYSRKIYSAVSTILRE